MEPVVLGFFRPRCAGAGKIFVARPSGMYYGLNKNFKKQKGNYCKIFLEINRITQETIAMNDDLLAEIFIQLRFIFRSRHVEKATLL